MSGNKLTNYPTLDGVYHTYSTVSHELWPMIDSVMSSCCSHMTAAVELATRYTTTDTIEESGTTSVTVE